MTEKEWFQHCRLREMADVARGYACTCCGCLWVASADGMVLGEGQKTCPRCPDHPVRKISNEQIWGHFARTCNAVCQCFIADEPAYRSRTVAWWVTAPDNSTRHCDCTIAFRAALLRDLVGNPFKPITLPKKQRLVDCGPFMVDHYVVDTGFGDWYCPWVTAEVLSIAKAAYDNCDRTYALDNNRLLILADALQDAGCNDEQVLAHLRSSDRHYRGCWVLDLLLGYE